jgi:hypothetical protein
MTQEQIYVFGWVSTQVAQNFAAWAAVKEYGTEAEAEQFYTETVEEHPHEDFFCLPFEA